MKETGISKNKKADGTGVTDKLYLVLRIAVLFAVLFMFIPGINPARISKMETAYALHTASEILLCLQD
jgi:putative aldouronate transport system permease protein